MDEHTPTAAVVAGRMERNRPKADYSELKRRVKEQGLLDKQPGFIARKMLINFALLGLSVAVLFLSDSLWLQIPNAVLMAFVFGQFGFVAHDAGHRQAFRTPRRNDLVGMLHANVLLGMSFGWWLDKHNKHHANPNQHDADPDIDMPVLAFSEQDALKKRGLFRFLVKHQAIFFFPLLLLQALSLHAGSVGFLLSHKTKYRALEAVLLLVHVVAYVGVIIAALGLGHALVFMLVQQALFGFYLASVFAPNHKGMLVLGSGDELGFMLRQVLTARNVHPHPITDFWYGGLNYQIEHHLFPTLARNKLREAHVIIKRFCEEHEISYYQTSMLGSYREIIAYLHQVSAPLRANAEQPRPGPGY
ncbi:MAG: fatty acid desaturase [Trueperaceae bacterium]